MRQLEWRGDSVGSGLTRFMSAFAGVALAAVGNASRIRMEKSGHLGNFEVETTGVGPVGAETYTFEVFKNGGATGRILILTAAEILKTLGTKLVVAKGDDIDFRLVTSAGAGVTGDIACRCQHYD